MAQQESEYDDLRATLDQLVADKAVLEKKLHAAQSVQSACKVWLDRLPEGTALELAAVKADGHDLAEVRTRLKATQAELVALRAVPASSADIQQRIERYVAEMARPTISGVGSGERLKVIWPGAGFDERGPREHRADVLSLMALLQGDAMVAALMREVERMADEPLPRAERNRRIAALDAELAELASAIASGEDVHHSPDAPPAAVLGVRIAETKKSRAA